jgi:hypothetical protein
MPRSKPELISPAGDWTSMRAALDAGADAIYFGAEGFNMRAASKGFSPGDFGGIARLCRSHGAKAYLALNSVIYDPELGEVDKTVAAAKAAGASLRLQMFIGPSAAELNGVYWETMRDTKDGSPLFTGETLLFSRYLSASEMRLVNLRPRGDLRALVFVANPTNLAEYKLAAVDVAGETALEKLAHWAGEHRQEHAAPRLLVASGVEQIRVALVLEEVHVRVVHAFAGAGFEDRIERAEFPSGQVFRPRQERDPAGVPRHRGVQVNDIVVRRKVTEHRTGAILVVDAGERQTVQFAPAREV